VTRTILKFGIALLVGLIAAGVLYERLGEQEDRKRYPQVGRSISIGDRTLNLYCSGVGAPAVIFESAGHTAGYSWVNIQEETAKFTQACWYDRAGLGWSDPGPSPRTFRAIAQDLHDLLRAAAIPGPYVLAGATAGAFHVRVYNGMFPGEVAGAVLIHATDPEAIERESKDMKGALGSMPRFVQKLGCAVLAPVVLNVGLLRLMGNPGAGRPYGLANLSADQQRELIFLSTYPGTVQTEGEGCELDEDMGEVRAAGNFGSRPLYVLAGPAPFRSAELNEYWVRELQPHLAGLSTNAHLILKEGAEDPAAVVQAVHDVIRSLVP